MSAVSKHVLSFVVASLRSLHLFSYQGNVLDQKPGFSETTKWKN
jgi:hypothetical protein